MNWALANNYPPQRTIDRTHVSFTSNIQGFARSKKTGLDTSQNSQCLQTNAVQAEHISENLISLKLILPVVNQLTLLPLPLLRFSYALSLVSGSLTYGRINIFCSFSFAISIWSPAHGILTILLLTEMFPTCKERSHVSRPPITSDFPPGYIRWANLH